MNKKFAIATLALSLLISGCASKPIGTGAAPQSPSAENVVPEPADLTGTWTQSNSMSDDSYQEAVIDNDIITINWVMNNGDTKSLYWVGSFEAPVNAAEPYTWTSKRDKKATENAMMASGSDTKEFTFTESEISYEASILGTTSIVRLAK